MTKKKTRSQWTPEEDAKLEKLVKNKWKDDRIAETMNKTPSAIGARRKRLGLMKRPPYKSRSTKPAKVAARVAAPLPTRKVINDDCTIRLEYPGGQTLQGTVSRELADELALRILSGEA